MEGGKHAGGQDASRCRWLVHCRAGLIAKDRTDFGCELHCQVERLYQAGSTELLRFDGSRQRFGGGGGRRAGSSCVQLRA